MEIALGETSMLDVAAVREELTGEVGQIQFEVDTLWTEFQKTPHFFGNSRHFTDAHYGYMMTLFARIDLLSRYWKGKGTNQTKRMVDFLDHYVHRGKRDASQVAVQLWRHILMHTGEGRFLKDSVSGDIFTWQIAFGP